MREIRSILAPGRRVALGRCVTVGLLAAGLLTAGAGVPARAAGPAAAATDRAAAGPVAEVADNATAEGAAEPGWPPPARWPRTSLRLQVEGAEPVTLRCGPPGGTHPRAAAACAALRAVGGDFERLPRDPLVLCPAIHAPVTAHAAGTWRGRPVSYTKAFGNRCELHASTGPVFAS